ncbi:uncharacterized protein LOC112050198 isoform X2 [Bicyclus anynana]|uniref:glycogenin glucosyltransferase n=1 Tax=Bicyclus anynana TaxID=110368 RepID=A0ABM3LK51_BICAN|nr:uncharacterized protein LOC112050198 isoform X2 [Bicyclus anynana]
MSNRAWVTLATNDSYGLGALVVAHSLRRSGSVYPAVVLITPSVTEAMRERLRAVFAEVVVVDVLDSKDAAHLALLQRPELGITFTKIHCWNLTQYEKCVFLDADTLIIQNCDELFEREELSAAPDVGWPDCFNSGVFVFSPSVDTFSNLITFASERGSFDGGDQGLLNSYFSDWARGDINKHLPFLYNVTSAAFYSYIPALKHYGQNLKIIHFIGAAKPWLQQFNWQSRSVDAPEHLRGFLQLWWDLFVGQVHSQLDTAMGDVAEEHLVTFQEETDYSEPNVDHIYYEPTLDSDSEFPWHHPDNQVPDMEINVPEINLSEFHNPWDIYRGNIPASKENLKQNDKPSDNYHEIRKLAWDRNQSHQTQSHHYEHTYCSNEHNDNQTSVYKDVRQSNNESSQTNAYIPYHIQSDHYHQHQQQETNHQHHAQNHHNIPQYHNENTSTAHQSHHSQHIQEHNYSEPHTHEYHYNNFTIPEDRNPIYDQSQSNKSPDDSHVCYSHSLQEHENHVGKKLNSSFSHLKQPNRPQVYSVMMDHIRVNPHVSEEKVNGYASDDDSDIYEEITPRHPYDGFYLRHRMTIDSRGRKICSHEIPLRPPSPLSESSDEFEDAMETLSEEITDKTINGVNIQTGVAGNLARVVPGAPLQQEAVDELTRRQGWEAGNIDYMGADSFDNIWAKISQTLSQPPSSEQAEPPKDEAQPEAAAEPPSAPTPVETVVEPASETAPAAPASEPAVVTPENTAEAPKQEVEAEKQAPSEPASVEVPAPVESDTAEKPSDTPAAQSAEDAAVVESAPVEVAAPASAPASEATEASTPAPEATEAPTTAPEAPTPEAPTPAPEATEAPTPAPEASEAPTPAPEVTKAPAPAPEVTEAPAPAPEVTETPAEERHKLGKLLLPPPAADAALTPDSEAEDAAALAQSIIAGELRTPTVTEPTPPVLASPPAPPADSRLSVQEPAVPTPPIAVSLSQIGIKAKPTTAAQIESSVKPDSAPATPDSPKTADPPKKKIIKKVVKKDKEGASGSEAPVPPPRKKEKKPKEK